MLDRGIVGISDASPTTSPSVPGTPAAEVGNLPDRARPGGVEVVANRGGDVLLELTAGGLELAGEEPLRRLRKRPGADELERLDDDGRIFAVLRKPHRCKRLAAQELSESAASVISD